MLKYMGSKRVAAALVMLGVAVGLRAASADAFIVKDGKSNAEIVVAADAPRTTRLAARELQTYLEKISGAKLPIANAPGGAAVEVYVGRSPATDKLGVKPYDVKDGGYRIVSGDKWLALIGRDDDFTPIEPWPRSNSDWTSGRIQTEWDELTGDAKWGVPVAGMYKRYSGRAAMFGKPAAKGAKEDGAIDVWTYDEHGSYNAVSDFLRSLGVRWYMPGELGEVVPTLASIALPRVDEVVRPDFPVRRVTWGAAWSASDVAPWAMRLGTRDPYGLMVAHGIDTMTRRPEFLSAHPDYFALYGGKRNNEPGASHNQPCLSSDGLLKENVAFAGALFDHYKFDVVSIMPPDAFIAMCQCPLCEGKDTPERGSRGRLSDYVWDYVNRAAKEVAKTHPDKKILCCAYGSYTLPPLKIDKLNPNIIVCIVGGRRPTANKPEQQEEVRQLREAWTAKTDTPIMVFENYPFTGRGFYLPAYCPHVMGESINATKGMSMGEDIWFSPGRDFEVPGYNHFLIYFTARMYWGGSQQDADAMFDEYCRLFYGPAAEAMKTFFAYCEANYQDMQQDASKVKRCLELFAVAQGKADADSVYGKRIALVGDYLQRLKGVGEQLAEPRGPSPEQAVCDNARGITVDGKLDDPFWKNIPAYATGELKDLASGQAPAHTTEFKVAWGDENLYFAIRCEDVPGAALNIGTTRNEDPALWYGDDVEILLETDMRSYYQIAINPAGAVADIEREGRKQNFQWSSQAEVATQMGDGYWTIEARIPVIQDENDPYNQVIGHKPTVDTPWYFNLCRQRIRDGEREYSAFASIGEKSFHTVRKFGKLVVK